MTRFRITLLTVLLLAAIIVNTVSGGMISYAAADTGIIFDCVYDIASSKLTVTASVSNPQTAVNTAMFVLDYDSDILTAGESNIEFLGNAVKSGTYFASGHIGADWYYSDGLQASAEKAASVRISFTVKNGTDLSDIKKALSVCDDSSFLDECGGYGGDGGVLLCVSSSEYYNAANNSASAVFNYSETEPEEQEKVYLNFHSIYSATDGTLITTVSVDNRHTKVGSAMFVLTYDSSKLSATGDSVSYLSNAKKSAVYSQAPYIGADWYYDTAIPAADTPSEAVRIVFKVADGLDYEELISGSPLSICSENTYLSTLGYENEGGLLVCANGTTTFSYLDDTADAVFTYEKAADPTSTSTKTTTTNSTTATTIVTKTTSTTRYNYKDDPTTGDDNKGIVAAAALICLCAVVITVISYNYYANKKQPNRSQYKVR